MAKRNPPKSGADPNPERLKQLESELKAARAGAEESRKSIEALSKERDSAGQELKQAKDDLAAARKAEAATSKDLEAAKKDLESAQKEIETLRKRHQSDQVKELAERSALEDRVAELEKRLKASEKESADALKKTQREADDAKKDAARLEKERDARAADLDRLKSDIAETEKTFSAELKAHRKTVPELKSVGDDPQAVIERLIALVRELREKLAAAAEREKALDREREHAVDAETLEQRITELVALNRKLQDEVDAAKANADTFRSSAEEAKKSVDEAVKREVARIEKELSALKRDLEARTKENASLVEQLQTEGRTPYLSPAQVSRMIDSFHAQISANLTQLDIRESELRLKIGFGGISDEKSGVIVPTAENIAKIESGLSEVVIRLGKSAP